MTVYDYFHERLGDLSTDETLKELLTTDGCGEYCVKAIDAAALFAALSDPAVKDQIVTAADETVQIFWRG